MIKINKQIEYLAGLTKSGSILFCQLLDDYLDIYNICHSSPLLNTLKIIRKQLSDDPFMLSQMNVDFDITYNRLKNSHRGFMNSWFHETKKKLVVE